MKLVVDANIIFAALLKDAETRKILLFPEYYYLTPDFIKIEIENHKDEIIERLNISRRIVDELLSMIFSNIKLVEYDKYEKRIDKAYNAMKNIDEDDTPLIALCLSIPNDGIWTEDRHFQKQNLVKIWKTRDIIDKFNENIQSDVVRK
jgi:predicted nucleic acid-binding protein